MVSSTISDLSYALRQMRLAPVLTITVILTLGLGIGATTAIFSLIHAVMLRSLPVSDPEGLFRIGTGKTCCYSTTPQGEILLGLLLGLPIAVLVAKLLSARLYKVGTIDPVSLGLPAASLLLSALVASALPARRAASVEPLEALRTD